MNLLTRAAVVLIMLATGQQAAPQQAAPAATLFTRTAAEVLDRNFATSDVSYLLLDLRRMAFVARRWEASEKPVPAGSLVKPFTAIAYAEAHNLRFPAQTCSAGSCWLPRGHGPVDIVRATALSCNSYFTALASKVSAAEVAAVAQRFGLNGPPADAAAEALIGMHGRWQESPQALALAYAELLGRRSQPAIREIVAGMAAAARNGTAAGLRPATLRRAVVAKTGTAPCTHSRHAPGDGFVVLAWPADAPHYLLLVREHGKPGAHAAVVAGNMLGALEQHR